MNSKNLKALTITIVFQAQSLNYGEGIANISELKKLTRADGNTYTIASRQCLRYDIVRMGHEIYNWNLQVVDKAKGTVQFRENISIVESPEMDLFGYMKTLKKEDENKGGAKVRAAVARLSNAISLEPYRSDIDFLSNKGLADRIEEHPIPVNIEQHLSFYTYTLTIDLEKVGVDNDLVLNNSKREERLFQLLGIVQNLNRNIRGRQENLSPLFVIGGIYEISNPFFLGRIKLKANKEEYSINPYILKEVLDTKLFEKEIKELTAIGIAEGIFTNKKEFEEILPNKVFSVGKFFDNLRNLVKNYYEV